MNYEAISATERNGHRCYQVNAWQQFPIEHSFGCRNRTLGTGTSVRFFETVQVHGNRVMELSQHTPDVPIHADAFVTTEPGIVCAVRTADCVPILMYHPIRNCVAAVHAGWRGIAAGIIPTTCEYLRSLGARHDALQVAIGPAIGQATYEVDAQVIGALRQAVPHIDACLQMTSRGRAHADLRAMCVEQLLHAGCLRRNIAVSTACTFTQSVEFHSHRREPNNPGRQWSSIRLLT